MGQFLDIPDEGPMAQSPYRAVQPGPGLLPEQVATGQATAETQSTEQAHQRVQSAADFLKLAPNIRKMVEQSDEGDWGLKGGELYNTGREVLSQIPGGSVLAAAGGTTPDEMHQALVRHQTINSSLSGPLRLAMLNMHIGGGGGTGGRGGIGTLLRGGGGGEGGRSGVGGTLNLGDTSMTKDAVLANLDSEIKYALDTVHPNGAGRYFQPGAVAQMIGTDQPTLNKALALGRWPSETEVASQRRSPAAAQSPAAPAQPAQPAPGPTERPGPMIAGPAMAATPQPAMAAEPVKVNSEEELVNKVPIGGRFIGPSGKVRIRTK